MRILYSTNCYHKDYKIVADEYEYRLLLNDYPFAERWIIILNVNDEKEVVSKFKGKVDRCILASEMAGAALNFFNLNKNSFKDDKGDGYIYSIASLIELYLARNFDYVCHYMSDVALYKRKDWITPAIGLIQNAVVSARPGFPRYEITPKVDKEISSTQDFSDHVYLIPVKYFRRPDLFSQQKGDLPQYKHPSYGGLSF